MWDEDCELRPGERARYITADDIVAIARDYMAEYGCDAEQAIRDMDWPVSDELEAEAIAILQKESEE